MNKNEAIAKLNTIIENSCTHDYCEFILEANDWVKYGKNRTYFTIIERSKDFKTSTHNKAKDYGYIDNTTGEYFPMKYGDLRENYTFGGKSFK